MSKHALCAALFLLGFSYTALAQDSAASSYNVLCEQLRARNSFLLDYGFSVLNALSDADKKLYQTTIRVARIIGLNLPSEKAKKSLAQLLDAGLSPYLLADICCDQVSKTERGSLGELFSGKQRPEPIVWWYDHLLAEVLEYTRKKNLKDSGYERAEDWLGDLCSEDLFAEDLYSGSSEFGPEVSPFTDRSSTTMCPSSPEEPEAGLSIRPPVGLAPSTPPSDVAMPSSMRLACEPGPVFSSPSRDSESLLGVLESRCNLMRMTPHSAYLGREATLQYRMFLLMQMSNLARPAVILGRKD